MKDKVLPQLPDRQGGGGYIRRGSQSKNWTKFSNVLLRDERLSYRQIGLMAHILSRPPRWRCHVSELSHGALREGRDAIRADLKVLRSLRYASLISERQKNATFRRIYIVYGDPKDNNIPDGSEQSYLRFEVDQPEPEKPASAEPAMVQPALGSQGRYKGSDGLKNDLKKQQHIKPQTRRAPTSLKDYQKLPIADDDAVGGSSETIGADEENLEKHYSRAELDRYAALYVHSPSALAKIDAVRRNNRRVAFLPKELSQLACEDLETRKKSP
jgi:hypothetical protein